MSLTLAFELAALRRLDDPEAAVADARSWCENVGVVSDKPPHVLTKFTRQYHVRNDFEPAVEPAAETLVHLLAHFETDRFVFVATDAEDAPEGWELQTVETAANRAGWTLLSEAEAKPDDTESRSRRRDDWP